MKTENSRALAVTVGSALQATATGECIALPPRGDACLNPPVKRGDKIRTLCRIVGEGNPGWLCGPYTVLYFSGEKPVYRAKWGKVDKVADEWIAYEPNTEMSERPSKNCTA